MDLKEKRYLEAKISDTVRQSAVKNTAKFVGFLDSSDASYAVSEAKRQQLGFKLYGGYENAERFFFSAFPKGDEPDENDFPITCLTLKNEGMKALSHRDILGAVMSLGIERDAVGDILTGDGNAVIFVSEKIAGYILSQVKKIASCGVKITAGAPEILPKGSGFAEMSDTVASERLDCVVAALASCSRNTAAKIIIDGLVAVDGVETSKPTKPVAEGTHISVRHAGKYIVDSLSDHTKKGRLVLKYRKYI